MSKNLYIISGCNLLALGILRYEHEVDTSHDVVHTHAERILNAGSTAVYRGDGRMELAQAYFPAIMPRSAWKKLKMLLLEDPQTASLATLSRRTFLPAEVDMIFSVLGVL